MEKDDRGLKAFILSQIEERGPVSFSQFMEWCLYHPQSGYYRTEGTKIGKEGDYYTSPSVHSLFGSLIAKQLTQMAEITGGDQFDVVELGGGRGFLCQDILNSIKKHAAPLYHRLQYHLVENGPFFLEEQKEKLSEFEKDGRVFWTREEDLWKEEGKIEGCFLSNELLDAFPVHRVVFDQGSLKEIFVTHKDGQFQEQWGELSDPRLSDYFKSMDICLEEGQKAEVNLKAMEWMGKVGRSLKRGFVLTIDYGFAAEELYAPSRREGTLLCYFQHRVSDNPYERLGQQDITSHVNFTSLIRVGEQAGLRLTGLIPQYRFLIALGILREMNTIGKEMSSMDGLKLRLTLKHLIDPEAGLGAAFNVLIQHKGVEKPELDGLTDLDSVPWPL